MHATSIPYHSLKTQTNIFHTFLPSSLCNEIVLSYSETEKIDNTGRNQDNLYNTDRTDWQVHKHPRAGLVAQEVCKAFSSVFHTNYDAEGIDNVSIDLFESWIASSRQQAAVEPHCHTLNPFIWSFVFYAKVPNEVTSLRFFCKALDHLQVDVREGDLLFFPSTLEHYSNDTVEGRTIYSGNFTVSVKMRS